MYIHISIYIYIYTCIYIYIYNIYIYRQSQACSRWVCTRSLLGARASCFARTVVKRLVSRYLCKNISAYVCFARKNCLHFSICACHPSDIFREFKDVVFEDVVFDNNSFVTLSFFTRLDLCVSSLRRGHANLLCVVPISTDDPRRESQRFLFCCLLTAYVEPMWIYIYIYIHIYIYRCICISYVYTYIYI